MRLAAFFLVAALAAPLPAQAAERKLWAGGGLGLMTLDRTPYSGSAIGLHLGLRYALNDQFLALAEISWAPYNLSRPAPSPCPEPPEPCERVRYPYRVQALTAAAGVAYVLDVTRLQPYFGLLLGGSRVSAGDTALNALRGYVAPEGKYVAESRFDVVLAAGADYHATERWAVGAAFRLHMAPPGGLTSSTQFIVQVQRSFGW